MSLSSSQFWPELLEKVRIADEIQNNVNDISAELETILKLKLNNKIRIYPFGSRVLGIAQPTSDLDIYVEFDDSFYDYSATRPTVKAIERQRLISKVFDSQLNWIRIENRGGKCPIVIIKNRYSSLTCDISCSECYAYCQNQIVLYLFKLQPIARYMIIYLRGWVKKHYIHEEFRSHVLILMLIFFLQIRKHLPSIHALQADLSPRIGPYIYHFNELKSNEKPNEIPLTEDNVRAKLKEFFQFYGSFEFGEYAICPYLGAYVKRRNLNSSMPERYKLTNWDNKFTRFSVAIQDFIDLNHNKGWLVRDGDLRNFQMKCKSV